MIIKFDFKNTLLSTPEITAGFDTVEGKTTHLAKDACAV